MECQGKWPSPHKASPATTLGSSTMCGCSLGTSSNRIHRSKPGTERFCLNFHHTDPARACLMGIPAGTIYPGCVHPGCNTRQIFISFSSCHVLCSKYSSLLAHFRIFSLQRQRRPRTTEPKMCHAQIKDSTSDCSCCNSLILSPTNILWIWE